MTTAKADAPLAFDWQDFDQVEPWRAWRKAKIRAFADTEHTKPVAVDSLDRPAPGALAAIAARCAASNFALYQAAPDAGSVEEASASLMAMARALGLGQSEAHRSAGHEGVVVLRTSQAPSKQGYIPYTRRPMNWHTDGYYNPSGHPVMSFVLHCHAQAAAGGENQLIDPEMAYLAMRSYDPRYAQAMMHPEAMTIPENVEPSGAVRPASVGPVFFADPLSGRLQMRYTARTRSIAWREDTVTQEAADWLRGWLSAPDAPTVNLRLEAGQGIVSNNALHNRTGFEDADGGPSERTILRIRFHERLEEDPHGTS